MKVNTFRNIGAAVMLFGSMGSASLAQAFVLNGALGGATGSADVYRLECPAGTATVKANVQDGIVDNVRLVVAVVRPIATAPEKLKASLRVTPDGGNSAFADDVPVPGFAETFFVILGKDAVGVVNYTSTMRCDDANGTEIGAVAPTIVQEK